MKRKRKKEKFDKRHKEINLRHFYEENRTMMKNIICISQKCFYKIIANQTAPIIF